MRRTRRERHRRPNADAAGDYQWAEADSDHVEQWTDTGALVYLIGPEDLFG